MNRFGFVIHPISVADYARKYPIARFLPPGLVERLGRLKSPMPVGEIRGIRSEATGEEVSGLFVVCPLTTRQLTEDPAERSLPRIIEAVRVAGEEGAQIVGLGAMTAVVGDAGITIAGASQPAVTTGNTYTVATALEGTRRAAQLMGTDLPTATAVVLGATGSIGRVCAQELADEVARLILIVRDRERGEALAASLGETRAEVSVDTDLDLALPAADLLLCVSASADALVHPRHLKPGAVVCDVARPRDVSISVARERDDVLVLEGGVVRPPGEHVDLGFNFGFPPGLMYACMAETALLALDGRFEPFTLGRDLQRERVAEISALAAHHGFRLAGFRSFERALTDDDLTHIREHAAARRAAASQGG